MHLAKSHALSTPDYTMFSCAECNYKSNSKAYLSFHKKRMHTARPGLWMCMAGACKEKPRSFLNQHQHQKHQQDHANVNCSVCNKSFSAKRNLKRHIKTVHKAVEMDVSRNSNNSNPDNNLNEHQQCYLFDGPFALTRIQLANIHGLFVQNQYNDKDKLTL